MTSGRYGWSYTKPAHKLDFSSTSSKISLVMYQSNYIVGIDYHFCAAAEKALPFSRLVVSALKPFARSSAMAFRIQLTKTKRAQILRSRRPDQASCILSAETSLPHIGNI